MKYFIELTTNKKGVSFKMKTINIVFLFAILVSGCMTSSYKYIEEPRGFYTLELEEVVRPENVIEQFGNPTIINSKEKKKDNIFFENSYEDNLIKIVWTVTNVQFNFILENKSEHTVKIIWDDAVYIDITGTSQKVMHSGVKYTDRNNSQIPTVVIKNVKIEDLVSPTNNVYYRSGKYGGWTTSALFLRQASTKEILIKLTGMYFGKTVKVVLPLQVQDVVYNYSFIFKVVSFTID